MTEPTPDSLRALADQIDNAPSWYEWTDWFDLISKTAPAIHAAAAAWERDRKDAERYRAIRNDAVNPRKLFAVQDEDAQMVGVESMYAGAELDAAIDAAKEPK